MTQLLRRILPTPVVRVIRRARGWIRDPYATPSYAQEGEDMVLRRLLEGRRSGFYVDVGAHHPRRFSNTYHFYRRGWRGINVDATPGSMATFRRQRPRDTNIECAVSRDGREMVISLHDEGALNTLAEVPIQHDLHERYQVRERRSIATRTLASILSEHLPPGQKIDFMSVDVEGLDLEVLQGNDWNTYRPDYLLVEAVGRSLSEVPATPVGRFLADLGFRLVGKTVHTLFWADGAQADKGGRS